MAPAPRCHFTPNQASGFLELGLVIPHLESDENIAATERPRNLATGVVFSARTPGGSADD